MFIILGEPILAGNSLGTLGCNIAFQPTKVYRTMLSFGDKKKLDCKLFVINCCKW